jgi:HYR domain-containing protein
VRRSTGSFAQLKFLGVVVLSASALMTALSCSDSTSPSRDVNVDAAPAGVTVLTWDYPDSLKNPPIAAVSSPIRTRGISATQITGAPSSALSAAVAAPTYVVAAVPFAPEAAPTAGLGPNCDDCLWIDNPIGFDFAFFGKSYNKISIGSNGIVGFGVGNMRDGCCKGGLIPVNDVNNNIIALGQSDWMPNSVVNAIRYETRGTAPKRRFVLQFTNVKEYGGSGRMTVQLVLSEGSNDITIYSTTLNSTVPSHVFTQGIENADGSEAAFVTGRVASVYTLANDAVRFSLVHKNESPAVTAPANLTVSTDAGVCAAAVDAGVASVTDDAPGATLGGARGDGLLLDAVYPRGVTTITWTATDADGLTATATQTVTVNDTEKPSLSAPSSISVRVDAGAPSATVATGTATAADNCAGVTVAGARNDAPLTAAYPIGVTTITWTATDASGNAATATQTITVQRNSAPTISAPGSLAVNTDPGVCSAMLNVGAATASDDVDGVSVSASRSDGASLASPFPKGQTTITWTATDQDKMTSSVTQTVIVNDDQNPSITAPASISSRTNVGASFATVDVGTPVTSDNCPNVVVTGARSDGVPMSGNYLVGTTNITWTAIDATGNRATAHQTVVVVANTPPIVAVPANIVVNTDPGACFAAVNVGMATVTDDADGARVAASSSQRPFGGYPAGTTIVTWTATDADGATSSATQSVTVNDRERPSITAPANISVTVDAGGASASVDVGAPVVADNCTNVFVTGLRSDGASLAGGYPIGSTTITWTATDASGNTSSASQSVTVREASPLPASAPANITVNATMPAGARVSYSNSGGFSFAGNPLQCSPSSGSIFPIGSTSVTCSVSGTMTRVGSSSFTVTVLGAREQVANLIDYVKQLDVKKGEKRKLLEELDHLHRSLGKKSHPSCASMKDFIKLLDDKHKHKQIPAAYATVMLADAHRISDVMGCRAKARHAFPPSSGET